MRAKILIVDDNPGAVEALEGVLAGEGYDLFTAANGREALELVAREKPDLVLLDVMMPEMDGYQVCERIRADRDLGEVPVVMVTALDDKESRVRGIEAGADDFVSKPIDRLELRARVRTITNLNRFRLLLEERRRFDELFELSPDSILVLDTEGTIRLANSRAQKLLCPEGSLLGEPFGRFLAQKDRSHWEHVITEASHVGSDATCEEVEIVPDGGTPIAAEISLGYAPLDGEAAAQMIIRDVSERLRMREEVERSQRLDAIGRAAAGIVHDFNNILQVIRVDAEIARRGLGPASEHAEDLDDIVRATEEGAALTKQLLVFASRGSIELRSVDLNVVVSDVEQILEHVVGKGCHLDISLSEDALPIEGDPTQVVQVLTNLVVNARDALGADGHIWVSTRSVAGGDAPPDLEGRGAAVLRVRDDGSGMDRHARAHLFEPFFTTKGEDGTGLGLSVTHGIVQSHGGAITVESQPGVGTTFDVYFPSSE